MMLMAAFLLVIAFVALASQVARVGQLGSETLQEQRRPILLEVEPVVQAVDALVAGLQDPALGLAPPSAAYAAALGGALAHLEFLEAARGFLFTYELSCGAGVGQVVFQLTDGEVQVSLESSETYPC